MNFHAQINRFQFIALLTIILSCTKDNAEEYIYQDDLIRIIQLTDNTYQHISDLDVEGFGLFPCNGLILKNNDRCLVLDTPPTTTASINLLNWIKDSLQCKVEGVIVNHHHVDCLGGLDVFHKSRINSYGLETTELLAKEDDMPAPKITFKKSLTYNLGNMEILNYFPGEAHSSDNIVSYIPNEKLLFGGCMVKELGAGKGNLNDANLKEWSNSVQKIKENHPDLKIVVPGHGKTGNIELLDYTIEMFKNASN